MTLSVPILDTTFVTVQRLLEGRPVSEGGRDHTSHGLVALGVAEERAGWILWILALVGTYLMSARFRRRRGGGEPEEEAAETEALYRRLLAFHERLPVLAFALDVVLIGLAYYASYLIRWDPAELGSELAYFQRSLPVVLAAKLVVFGWVGAYGSRWKHFGMEDALRMVQANVLGTILVATALLLLQRVGLSRGVLMIDFLACAILTTGARFSFRLMEGMTGRFSAAGQAAVAVGPPNDAEPALRKLRRADDAGLRVVAVVDPTYGPARGGFRGIPVFAGRSALVDAVAESGAHAVVVVERDGRGWTLPESVRRHLRENGALDVYVLRVGLRRLERKGPWFASAPGPGREEEDPRGAEEA